mmetsp:Transcript_70368/g.182481  ORF Transcript_70368/g.182481 Transcript_70368/m.182481 type:complete len:131 (+) Transcript_70368:110-502(+)
MVHRRSAAALLRRFASAAAATTAAVAKNSAENYYYTERNTIQETELKHSSSDIGNLTHLANRIDTLASEVTKLTAEHKSLMQVVFTFGQNVKDLTDKSSRQMDLYMRESSAMAVIVERVETLEDLVDNLG